MNHPKRDGVPSCIGIRWSQLKDGNTVRRRFPKPNQESLLVDEVDRAWCAVVHYLVS